jgi:hypothetical protein
MPDLTPEAAALLRAGREGFRPTASDRERVLEALSARLGESILLDDPGAGAPGAAPVVARFALRRWLLIGLPALGVSAGWGAVRELPRTVRADSRPAAVTAAPTAADGRDPSAVPPAANGTDSVASVADLAVPGRVSNAQHAAVARTTAQAADGLGEEVRLLSRAQQDLNDGRPARALKTLAEHEQRFPTGALAEERLAMRVQALCVQGRRAEANLDLTELSRAFPGSVHIAPARAACGSYRTSTP